MQRSINFTIATKLLAGFESCPGLSAYSEPNCSSLSGWLINFVLRYVTLISSTRSSRAIVRLYKLNALNIHSYITAYLLLCVLITVIFLGITVVKKKSFLNITFIILSPYFFPLFFSFIFLLLEVKISSE